MAGHSKPPAKAATLPLLQSQQWIACAFSQANSIMPNQRSKNKVYLGGFVDRQLHREIIRLTKAEGMAKNKFGFVEKLIHEALQSRKDARAVSASIVARGIVNS